MHAIDLVFAAAVTLLTSGTSSPFFVLFLFTLVTAAYRWGFAETVATAVAAIALLVVDAALIGPVFQGASSTSPTSRIA